MGTAEEGISISKVKPGSSSEASGVIEAGMFLHEMNGESLAGASKADVVGKMKSAGSEISLVLGPSAPKVETSEEDDLVKVTLGKPLGLSITGDAANGITVSKVKEGSSAATSGLFKIGMRLVNMDGQSVIGKEKAEIVSIIKAVTDTIVIGFAPPKVVGATSQSGGGDAGSFEVVLAKPLGMSVSGDAQSGIMVTKVKAGSSAEASGKIQVGMTLLAMDGASLVGSTKAEVVNRIKSAGAEVKVRFSTSISSLPEPGGATASKDPTPSADYPEQPLYDNSEGLGQSSRQSLYDNSEGLGDPAPAPAASGEDFYADKGKLAIIKVLRAKGIDYKGIKDVNALKDLARAVAPNGL
jgi:hypothetical protein